MCQVQTGAYISLFAPGKTCVPCCISQLTQFMHQPETYKNFNRESAYDVPGPYWCLRLTPRAWKTCAPCCMYNDVDMHLLSAVLQFVTTELVSLLLLLSKEASARALVVPSSPLHK